MTKQQIREAIKEYDNELEYMIEHLTTIFRNAMQHLRTVYTLESESGSSRSSGSSESSEPESEEEDD